MLSVLFWVVLSLLLMTLVPDPWEVRRNIARREARLSVLRGYEITIARILAVNNDTLVRVYVNKGTWQRKM
jgi:hypothetical protein